MDKKYLSELLGSDFREFRNAKVFITAPTGLGKTTFIIEKLLPYLAGKGQRTLILCNRRLLREQYWYDVVKHYDFYDELTSQVEITSYQSLAQMLQEGRSLITYMDTFQAVVLDEYHYFYADSCFNGYGTYILLHALIEASAMKLMVFLSATSTEVKPLVEEIMTRCANEIKEKLPDLEFVSNYYKQINYDFSYLADYKHVTCRTFPDEETMCQQLAASEWKSLVFVDDKGKAEKWKNLLIQYGAVKSDIRLLSSDSIEEGQNIELIRKLTVANRLSCKILISTSVLDNGVSVRDAMVRNLVIVTDSRLSFLQMLGRLRTESGRDLTLYFLIRHANEFETRMNIGYDEMREFENLSLNVGSYKSFSYLGVMWNNPEDRKSKFYRKALVVKPTGMRLHTRKPPKVTVRCGDAELVVNDFARQKTGNDYLIESRLYSLAIKDPIQVVYEQMHWMQKKPEELMITDSTFQQRMKDELQQCLCSVIDYSNDQLQKVKKDILPYVKELFSDISTKNGTLSKEKLMDVCEREGLELIQYKSEGKRECYTIQKVEEKLNN